MAEPFHQISAAVPFVGLAGGRLKLPVVKNSAFHTTMLARM